MIKTVRECLRGLLAILCLCTSLYSQQIEIKIFKPQNMSEFECNDRILVFNEPELLSNPNQISRLENNLDSLNKMEMPEKEEKVLEWILKIFPDFSVEENEFGKTINMTWTAWYLAKINFDNKNPTDYYLWLRGGGSMGGYSVYLILQGGRKIVYQYFDGCLRGRNNLVGIFSNPKEFLRKSGFQENPVDLNNDRKKELIIHNNLSFYSYYDPDSVSELDDAYYGSMAGITDFPVPYFYDGEKLVYNRTEGEKYYKMFLSLLGNVEQEHRIVITHKIHQILSEE